MADSDHTTTLSIVTRSKATAGRAVVPFSPNNPETRPDPAADVWGKWRAAHEEANRLCRYQQRLEADLKLGAGEPTGHAAALRAESEAGERSTRLLEVLSVTPAASLAGVAAKLDAVLGEGQPGEDDPEFPWPLIRSALEDIIRVGRLGEPLGLFSDRKAREPCGDRKGEESAVSDT